jgi:hypothetical protein
MGGRREYGESKRHGGAVLEGNRWAGKGEENGDIEEGVTSRLLFHG